MVLPNYFSNIITFFCIGIIFGIIFDFFRSIRKVKKSKTSIVVMQDIIYFIIIFCIMSYAIYLFLDDEIRIYILTSIVLGSYIYFKLLSKLMIKVYIFIINRIRDFLDFTFLPLKFSTNVCGKICRFFKKIVKNGCIKFLNVILYLWNRLFMLPRSKQKKKVEYEKSG